MTYDLTIAMMAYRLPVPPFWGPQWGASTLGRRSIHRSPCRPDSIQVDTDGLSLALWPQIRTAQQWRVAAIRRSQAALLFTPQG